MKSYELFKCRVCGKVFRYISIEVKEDDNPVKDLKDRGDFDSINYHQCSDKIAGIADFAGVEFSEE